MSVATEIEQVVDELRRADKLILTTHENPDGDALGSLLGMAEVLREMGKDVLMFLSADQFPVPAEYRHLPLGDVVHAPPPDMSERVAVFLDCGNIDRMPAGFLRTGTQILNVDHHHDNTRFGTVNLVDPSASSTAEIVFSLARELGVELTRPMAEALYVGLVTDTGRFMYENTSAHSHRVAAELIDAGVDPADIYRRIYEGLPYARLELLGRALARVERHDGGAITLTHLTRADYEETGAAESDTEGVVDHLRSVAGTKVAVVVRELTGSGRDGLRKASLRSTDGEVDVSLIARAHGGGGHRQAAGFTSDLPLAALVERLRAEIREQI